MSTRPPGTCFSLRALIARRERYAWWAGATLVWVALLAAVAAQLPRPGSGPGAGAPGLTLWLSAIPRWAWLNAMVLSAALGCGGGVLAYLREGRHWSDELPFLALTVAIVAGGTLLICLLGPLRPAAPPPELFLRP